MTDDLKSRVRRADPARVTGGTESSARSIQELMEAAMTNTPTRSTLRHARWLPAAAAAAVVVLGTVAGVAVLTDDPSPSPAAQEPAMELGLPASDVMSSCIVYSVDFLAQMPVAFSGEVLEAGGGTVVVEVDKWYRGGDADAVELVSPSGEMTSIDGVEFVEGRRYLVTAAEGTVSSCGYTVEWSPERAADFEAAFGG